MENNDKKKHIGEQEPMNSNRAPNNIKPNQEGNLESHNERQEGNPLKPQETQKNIKPEELKKK